MKCKYCGEEIVSDSVFCEHCGKKVKRKRFPRWAIALIVLGGLLQIIIIVILLVAYNNEEYTQEATEDTLAVYSDTLVNYDIEAAY